MKTILDPTFRYTASFNTDLKKTFARIRRAHRAESAKMVPVPAASLANVASIAAKTVPAPAASLANVASIARRTVVR